MRILLVELTDVEAANSAIVQNIVAAFDLKSVDTLVLSPPLAPTLAAQVFGGADAAPLAPAAPAAPSTAVAAPTSTAPVAEMPSTPAAAVFGQIAAVVAPAPNAPTAPAAQTSPAGVALDKRGFPWDYRIHAEGSAILKDGTWRQKRNTAPELRAAVESELRANGFPDPAGAPAPVVATAAPLAPPAPPAPPVTPPLTAHQQAQLAAAAAQAAQAPVPNAPSAPPAPGFPATTFKAPAPPVAAPVAGPMTFAQLMVAAQDAQFAKKITADWFAERRNAYGVTSLPALMQRPDVVECIAAELDAIAPRVAA